MSKEKFYRVKYRSMLLSGTFTMAMAYLMLLCDNIVAGVFIGADGVAAINIVSPLIGAATSVSICISIGVSILYTRAIGEMDRDRAARLYGMGIIVSGVLAVISMLMLLMFKGLYFTSTGASGEILKLAREYYAFLPFNAAVLIVVTYIEELVYADGDESLEMLSYVAQIGGNILLSILLAKFFGIKGIMLGTLIGNISALIVLLMHFLKKSNTLHFIPFFKWRTLFECVKYSITDGITYLLWGITNYVLITYITRHFGKEYLVVLAVVVSLVEFAVVFDGIGIAIQPLLGVYFGEKNHLLIKRMMKDAIVTAVIEGVVASILIFVFAAQFAKLFGIVDMAMLNSAVTAIRIMCLTLVAASLFMLMTSYYLYIDHVKISVGAIILKDGVLYILLPILFAGIVGVNGLWIGFAVSPVIGILLTMLMIRVKAGREAFPDLLQYMKSEIIVYDTVLTPENMTKVSETISEELKRRGYPKDVVLKAGLFAEEISSTIREKNKDNKILVEYSLIFDKPDTEDGEEAVRLVIRDSGVIFDITDPELEISGLSSFVINGLLSAQKEKDYVPTTGYNRNVIRFYKVLKK